MFIKFAFNNFILLQESTITSRETERIVCDWAETKLGMYEPIGFF